ncbi:dynamin family protein [Bacillus spizizenii]|uniref:dynamin family protein n=1 Tax=Bacillus spizizenii TaxID=96241 RepID=UPI002280F3B8|nr:dynamin family protein [Bacillus spizizenii]MCY7803840.1 dynamin family protein [Bacillus spizizenii]MCY7872526.1 dynamin family protein [Bacillus spizizenii]MCY7884875.1 dynamin family protein [Bacillus spizizenii]MCY7895404.1 dynamin family protein [Bacillus spizizenii]MCY7986096.1 dynamin family protein [Bacillus spizizenii]
MTEHNRKELLHKTGELYQQFIENQDEERAAKLAAIMKKAVDEEVYIAFTGHYSAGKSSLLNCLLMENILPTSPIPTSANLVVIRNGEKRVRLHTTDGACAELEGAYQKDKVQQYCKDGEQIESVEIFDRYTEINSGVAYIDTPGIDSTDDAHFLSAASILHQADALFYVVHYNHVHSEENVKFLRSIKESIQNVYFIVNQIDRHDETETHFGDYKAQVEEMLCNEGISKESLYFTSVTEPNHPFNQIGVLREELKRIEQQTKSNLQALTEQKVRNLLKEHTEFLLKDETDGPTFAEQLDTQTDLVQSLRDQLDEAAKQATEAENRMQEEVNRILKNANLTPFEMRELAAAFLESREPSFKTGFFFSKAKTAQERDRRRNAFFSDVTNRTEAEADWHMIDTFHKLAKAFDVHTAESEKLILAYRTPLEIDIIERAVKHGAAFSSEYVLQYTKDLAELIRKEAKRKAADIIKALTAMVKERVTKEFQTINGRLIQESEKLSHLQEQARLENNARKKADCMWAIWEEKSACPMDIDTDWFKTKKKIVAAPKQKRSQGQQTQQTMQKPEIKMEQELPLQDQIKRFHTLSDLLGEYSMLSKQTAAFRERIKRLEERKFTLALFGGFSSGKSSFANALVGEKVLPSSPTPTTATINKITKPTNDNINKTADVVFKTEEDITADILQLTGIQKEPAGRSFTEKWEKTVKKSRLPEEHIKLISNFLFAYETYQQYIQEQKKLTIPLSELKPYVAEETTACAVKEVTVYYTCPLTEKGITIVDTPGASSMNKRHTELAFQYIKDADAFFYMTYYQHSFSKGDRSFLRKLGLVKESLSMDKMFFVINAADLAKDKTELETVTDYVSAELVKEGIHEPQLFTVSSKEELLGSPESFYNQFPKVRKRLDRFIEVDVKKASAAQLSSEADKLCETVFQLHRSQHQSREEKEAQKKRLMLSFERTAAEIEKRRNSETIIEKVKKDTKEQLYHITQRLSFFANDLLKSAFHPGLQNGDWKKNVGKAMTTALQDYQFEYVQEIKTLDVRMSGFIERHIAEEWLESFQKTLNEDGYFSIYAGDQHSNGIQLKEVEPELDERAFEQEQKEIKSPKQFFEQKGKAAFIEAVRMKLTKITEVWVKNEEESLISHYTDHLRRLQVDMAEKAMEQIKDQKDTYLGGYGEGEHAKEIEKAYQACISWQRSDHTIKM